VDYQGLTGIAAMTSQTKLLGEHRWRSPGDRHAIGQPMTPDSDDVVTAGLRLLRELDGLFSVGAHTRLDAIPATDRNELHAALKAALAALAVTHRRKHGELG
jgi:hypothetical protein